MSTARVSCRNPKWNLCLGCLLLALATAASGASFTVTSTLDSGPGSLRQAILDANASPGKNHIKFALPGTPPFTLIPSSPLPAIIEPLDLDAATQPGYTGIPIIQLQGPQAGKGAHGLVLQTDGSAIRGLVINLFSGDGIRIEYGSTNVISGNFIGTDLTGTLSRPNGQAGVSIHGGARNRIGGPDSADRNVISANHTGVYMTDLGADYNVVQGNFIGTDVTGTLPLGNQNNGVLISSGSRNLIGGTAPGESNLISGNQQSGVYIQGGAAQNNEITGNFIGTDATGKNTLGNAADGVTVNRGRLTQIGGASPGAGNLISGNLERGVMIFGPGAINNRVEGNLIGTDATGRLPLGNRFSGIGITGVGTNWIGGTPAGAGNIISGNQESGILLTGADARDNRIEGNYIGTDLLGTTVLSNALNGITLDGAPTNHIGGLSPKAGNLISGNGRNGILLIEGAAGNRIFGNLIGTDKTGRLSRGNQRVGIAVETAGNRIGSDQSGGRNVISGNQQNGIFIHGPNAFANTIAGNFLGVDISGTNILGNEAAGIGIADAPGNLVGGPTSGARNVISGNRDSGIYITGTAAYKNRIENNYIGTDLTGRRSIGNRWDGVSIYGAPNNQIGSPGAGNLISGNSDSGVYVFQPGATGNIIHANFIGTRWDGAAPLGNQAHGVQLGESAGNNFVGGTSPGQGNVIAHAIRPGFDGVRVRSGTGNRIQGNSIFSNNGLGIDLGEDGVTPNDPGDSDTGANLQQNFPALHSALGHYITETSGVLNSRPHQTYTIDFYANVLPDASGYGEGRSWLGFITVATGATGNGSFSAALTNHFGPTLFLSATATDSANNTSEFSLSISVTGKPDSDGDGMPDDYEILYGLNPYFAGDAHLDLDGDGHTNIEEFRAGTNPADPESYLAIAAEAVDGNVFLRFDSRLTREYQILGTPSLASPAWSIIAEGLNGTGASIEVLVNSTFHSRLYYRLMVSSPADY